MTLPNECTMPVRTSDTPQERLKVLHGCGLSWREIAVMDAYRGIPPGSLSTYCKTGKIARKYRSRFGLPPIATVTVMLEGEIPEGTQVLNAVRCKCGRWYATNHPARRKCFICSPSRLQKGD